MLTLRLEVPGVLFLRARVAGEREAGLKPGRLLQGQLGSKGSEICQRPGIDRCVWSRPIGLQPIELVRVGELVHAQRNAQGPARPVVRSEVRMHAVVVKVSIKDSEAAQKALEEQVVPRVKQAPGFVAGYWSRSDDRSSGQGMILFESEEAARAAAEQLRANIPDRVTLESVEVREIVASA